MKKSNDSSMANAPLKLNYKRTFIIGFAFFGILMLWQVYNNYCPTILAELLMKQMGTQNSTEVQWIVGVIMALDNVFAIFMLPLFGSLSDKTHTRFGKRMPYIVIGTILASIALIFIPVAFAFNSLLGVIVVMALVLVFMQMYRNPAVSLMPDITPKPLRAKANGIINVVGYAGAIVAGALALFITNKKYFTSTLEDGSANPSYQNIMIYVPFIVASLLMIITMIILFFSINENKVLQEMEPDIKRGEALAEIDEPLVEDDKLSKKNKKRLWLLIIAIFLWFAAFNGVETFWSNYATYYLQFDKQSLATIILTICSMLAFVPAGIVSEKIGRKFTVIIGIGTMVIAMVSLFIISPFVMGNNGIVGDGINSLAIAYYGIFGVAGVGWAFINCCSYPMVVELSTQKTVGKYTGYYYTSSMLAQSLTPIGLGALMLIPNLFGTNGSGWPVTFPYSAVLFLAALVVFFFIPDVKNKKVQRKKGLEAFDQD